MANLWWEPSLSPRVAPTFLAQLRRHWLTLLAAFGWTAAVATLHFFANPHLFFAAFYLAPCAFLAWKADRRVAFIIAYVAGATGPLLQHFKAPDRVPLDVAGWNIVMRHVVFHLVVVLVDRVRKLHHQPPPPRPAKINFIQTLSSNWAVVLMTCVFFALVVELDAWSEPGYGFLPLYLLPCVIFTLALNWRWGTLAALAAAAAGPWTQRFDDPVFQHWGVELWNTFMRFLIFQTVVLLINRLRRDNVLFEQPEPPQRPRHHEHELIS